MNVSDGDGRTALHLACLHEHSHVAQYLLEQGVNVNAADLTDCTPLALSVRKRSDISLLLLSHGADANSADANGVTPLHWACSSGNLEAARALTTYKAEIDAEDAQQATPLHYAGNFVLGMPPCSSMWQLSQGQSSASDI